MAKEAKNKASSGEKKQKRMKRTLAEWTLLARRWLLPASILFVASLLGLYLAIGHLLMDDVVMPGTTVAGIPVGGLPFLELDAHLSESWPDPSDDAVITLRSGSWEKTVSFGTLSVRVNRDELRETLLLHGREGNQINRLIVQLRSLRGGYAIPLPISFDRQQMDQLLKQTHEVLHRKATGATLEISDTEVWLHTGEDGVTVDTVLLATRIIERINTLSPGPVTVPLQILRSPLPEPAPLLAAINVEMRNATQTTDDNGNTILEPAQTGRIIALEELENVLHFLETRTDRTSVSRLLPVQFTKPDITLDDLSLSGDLRITGTYATELPLETTMDQNRAKNIQLAAMAIDGMVIPRGSLFSFNETTGPRTQENGYVEAFVYENGEIVQGMGGGVCQVSSTLFNAMADAGLLPVERHAHTFKVSYTDPGRDASVAYGTQDLVFMNTYPHDIALKANLNVEKLQIDVLFPGQADSLKNRLYVLVLDTHEPGVRSLTTDKLRDGESQLINPGISGATVETWVQTWSGGNLIQEKKLFTSHYQAYPRKILIGKGVTALTLSEDKSP